MKTFKNLTGERYNKWTVLGLSHQKKHRYYFCRCDCGTEKIIQGPSLTQGTSVSCGCYRVEINRELHIKHGMVTHPAYQSWSAMRRRCNDPSFKSYERYGGRGIKVYPKWETFDGFWEDMGATWCEGLTIDRYPNGQGNYEPSNCRWATDIEQANNQITNVAILGFSTMRAAARHHGISYDMLKQRVHAGWPEERLLEPSGRP